MSRRRKSRHLIAFIALAVLGGEIAAAAAEVLVLRASGPSARRFPAGQRVPDNASFNLRPGDEVTVLAGGGTRTFRGPGTFSASGPARTTLAAAGPRRNIGATRGPGEGEEQPLPTDVWHLDVTSSGRACVAAGARPTLWRPNAERAVQLAITPPSGAARMVQWARGQSTVPWPANVPLTDGASYQFSWTGSANPTRLTVRTVPALRPGDAEGLASALLRNQCTSQLGVFIAQREVQDATGPGGGGR